MPAPRWDRRGQSGCESGGLAVASLTTPKLQCRSDSGPDLVTILWIFESIRPPLEGCARQTGMNEHLLTEMRN